MVYQLYQHRNGREYTLFSNDMQWKAVIGGDKVSINQAIGLINTISKITDRSLSISYYRCNDTDLGNFELKRIVGVNKNKPLTSDLLVL